MSGQIIGPIGVLPSAVVGYSGPGDTRAFIIFGSVSRAYTAAYATGLGNAVDLVDQAGANAITIKFLSTGLIDAASISTWVSAHTVTTIKVTKLYDQLGTNHWTQATLSKMPVLTLNAINGLPTMGFDSATSREMATGSAIAQAVPYTWEAVSEQTVSTNGDGTILLSNGNSFQYPFNGGGAGNLQLYGGLAVLTSAISINNYHVVQGTINGASSKLLIDGATVNSPPDIGSVSMAGTLFLGSANGSAYLDGNISEVGVYAASADTTVQSTTRTAYGL